MNIEQLTFPLFSLVLQIFHNCSCVEDMRTSAANMSAVLGQCPRNSDCDGMFKIYMSLSVIGSFISASGAMPGFIVLLRSETLNLKELMFLLLFTFSILYVYHVSKSTVMEIWTYKRLEIPKLSMCI